MRGGRPGGAALKDGSIKVGDLVTHVDKKPISHLDTTAVYQLLLGRRSPPRPAAPHCRALSRHRIR